MRRRSSCLRRDAFFAGKDAGKDPFAAILAAGKDPFAAFGGKDAFFVAKGCGPDKGGKGVFLTS